MMMQTLEGSVQMCAQVCVCFVDICSKFCGSEAPHVASCAVLAPAIMLHGKFLSHMWTAMDWAVDEVSVSNDQGPRLDLAAMDCDIPMDGDALNVSVMMLGGEVLATVIVSCRSSVWELKGVIEKGVPGRHMKAAWMTLMLGPQVLANAASLHDAGVVDGAMLCIIYAAIYKLLVFTAAEDLELWNHEGKREGIFLDPREYIFQGAEFSPDGTFVLTIHEHIALLWRVDTQEKCPFHFYHDGYLVSATFSPAGTTVLSACKGNDVKLWSVSSGQCVKKLEIGVSGDVNGIHRRRRCCFAQTRRSHRLVECGNWPSSMGVSGRLRLGHLDKRIFFMRRLVLYNPRSRPE